MFGDRHAGTRHHKGGTRRDVVRTLGIAAGAAQILVLGAGYDTLGWRLAPNV